MILTSETIRILVKGQQESELFASDVIISINATFSHEQRKSSRCAKSGGEAYCGEPHWCLREQGMAQSSKTDYSKESHTPDESELQICCSKKRRLEGSGGLKNRRGI